MNERMSEEWIESSSGFGEIFNELVVRIYLR